MTIRQNSGKCCLVEVPERWWKTFEPIIQRLFLPGSRIINDSWPSEALTTNYMRSTWGYISLATWLPHTWAELCILWWPRGSYPKYWEHLQRAKRKLMTQYGTSRVLFPSYLSISLAKQIQRKLILTLDKHYLWIYVI